MKKLIIITVLMAMSMSIRAQYRNVFVELGYDKAQVESKLHQVFNDVFRGPNKVYFEVDDSMGYVTDVKENGSEWVVTNSSHSPAQLDLIDKHLPKLDSVFLSKEIFLNYLNSNGLKISKPSFFLLWHKIPPF